MIALQRLAWLGFGFAAAAATAWRPATVGFLTDDWTVLVDPQAWTPAFSAERWQALEIAQNRPALRAILFVLTSLIPPEPVAWHVAGALLNLAAGLAVAVFARDVLRESPLGADAALVGGLFAGACWIAFPFSAATQFWATGTTAVPAVAAFAISGSLMLRGWHGNRPMLAFGAAISLLGYLVYEAHFFQFALLVAFAAAAKGWRGTEGVFAALAYGLAQTAAIVFGRLMRYLGAEGSRGLNENFIDTYFHWYLYVGRIVGLSAPAVYAGLAAGTMAAGLALHWLMARAGKPWPLWRCVTAMALAVAATATLATLPLAMPEGALPTAVGGALLASAGLRRIDRRDPDARTGLLVLAGVCVGALPFALGNYVVFSLGFGARATLGMSIWLALGAGWLAALASNGRAVAGRAALGMLLVWGGFAASDAMRGREWGRAAAALEFVFVDPPAFPFGRVPADAGFLLVAPELPGRVPVIEVNHHVFAIARRAFGPQAVGEAERAEIRAWEGRWFVARNLVWRTRWDGNRLVQIECRTGTLVTDVAMPALWVWNRAENSVRPARAPYESGCAPAP